MTGMVNNPAQKMGVLVTLFMRAFKISDDNHIEEEIAYLRKAFTNIGYRNRDIIKAIQRAKSENKRHPQDVTLKSKAYLPYIQGVTDKLAKVLAKNNIGTSFKPLSTIKHTMKSIKDNLDPLQQKGVYCINFSCGKCYIGET